jgi:hypothetical protein
MSISLLLVRLTRGVSSGQADVGEALLSYLIVELKFLLAPGLVYIPPLPTTIA